MNETPQKGNNGCLFVIGIFIIFSTIGLIKTCFFSEKKANTKKTNYLTLEVANRVDTILLVQSEFYVFKDNALKKTIEQSFTLAEGLSTYTFSIPDGFFNSVTIVKFHKDTKFDLQGSIDGTINSFKNNPNIENLTYTSNDTVIYNIKAKIARGKFRSMNETNSFKEVVIYKNDYICMLTFINKESAKKNWKEINEIIKNIEFTPPN